MEKWNFGWIFRYIIGVCEKKEYIREFRENLKIEIILYTFDRLVGKSKHINIFW